MNLLEEIAPVDYDIIHIDDKDYFFTSLSEDEVYNRYLGDGYPCESVSDFLCVLAEHFWHEEPEVYKKIKNSKVFTKQLRTDEKELTIAIYYRNIVNGGAQRVVSMLANLWAEHKKSDGRKKYKVILITDSPTEDLADPEIPDTSEIDFDFSVFLNEVQKEYDLLESVTREYIPSYKIFSKEKYRERLQAWYRIIEKYSVDIVVSGMWMSTVTFWDMLSIKAHPLHPAFILHNHNFACVPYLSDNNCASRLMAMYRMCDGIVVLSEMDKQFVDHFSDNVIFIPNPKPFFNVPEKIDHSSNNVLWVGRISKEKRPLDAIKAFHKVLEQCPDAKLYMVGSGDLDLISELVMLIQRLNIEDHVILPGFTLDVDSYYRVADVFLSTSMYEGFPTTATEAFSFSVPIVEYEMPWLYYSRDSRGIVTVQQGDYLALAEETVKLLHNPQIAREIGRQGKEKVDEINEKEILDLWDVMFNKATTTINNNEKTDLLIQYITEYQSVGKQNSKDLYLEKTQRLRKKKNKLQNKFLITKNDLKELRKSNKVLQRKYNKIVHSKAYRLSNIIMKPFRYIKKS